jgi:hypothetical protein
MAVLQTATAAMRPTLNPQQAIGKSADHRQEANGYRSLKDLGNLTGAANASEDKENSETLVSLPVIAVMTETAPTRWEPRELDGKLHTKFQQSRLVM